MNWAKRTLFFCILTCFHQSRSLVGGLESQRAKYLYVCHIALSMNRQAHMNPVPVGFSRLSSFSVYYQTYTFACTMGSQFYSLVEISAKSLDTAPRGLPLHDTERPSPVKSD